MKFVGRQEQVENLRDTLLFKKRAPEKLTILGIEGPGGVGKSSLISMAESGINYENLKTLRVFVDSAEPITTLVDLIDRLTKEIKLDAGRRFSRADIVLKETEQALSETRKLLSEAQSEAPDANPEALKNLFNCLMSAGKHLNKVSSKTKEYFDAEKFEEFANSEDNSSIIAVLQEEPPKWWNALGLLSTRKNLRNALRKNAAQVFSEALVKDIESILVGYNIKNVGKPLPSKISGCEKILLIIDDFESFGEFSSEFLSRYFLPKLKEARFQSAIVIAGRDDLTATNPSWSQHLHGHLLTAINVGPLSEEEIQEIAEEEGLDANVLWKDTDGYPYFIQLWIEAQKRGGETAVSLKKFYDRTTRWMSENQKNRLYLCLFIDEINIDSLKKMANSPSEAKEIFEWFKTEGSVRDTDAKHFTVRRYVRDRLLDYLRLCDPTTTSKHEAKARNAGILKS